jgi:hypothetical protein
MADKKEAPKPLGPLEVRIAQNVPLKQTSVAKIYSPSVVLTNVSITFLISFIIQLLQLDALATEVCPTVGSRSYK